MRGDLNSLKQRSMKPQPGLSHAGRRHDPPAAGALRLRLTIAFDGTRYLGWQLQNSGPTVQSAVQSGLAALFPSRPCVHGSSRTDTGVHAMGMVAHFDVLLN